MKKISVFTPTYNRETLLPRLYKSLCEQTIQDFEWIIVDDGSTDNTAMLISEWKNENKLDIHYYYQENKGKMQAHNKGVMEANANIFLCVDSDDYLINEALEDILSLWDINEIDSRQDIAGVLSYKGYSVSEKIGTGSFPNKKYCNSIDAQRNFKNGEMTMCFKTNILLDYLFPEIEGEKFITEAWAYKQIDQKYKYLLCPKILTICEYRNDGYTMNIEKIAFDNPIGRMYYELVNLRCDTTFYDKIIAVIKYDMYRAISKSSDVAGISKNEMFLIRLFYPVGWMFAFKKKRKMSKYK